MAHPRESAGSAAERAALSRRRWRVVLRWISWGAAAGLTIAVIEFGAFVVFRGRSPVGGALATVAAAVALALIVVAIFGRVGGRAGAVARVAALIMVYAAIGATAKVFRDRWVPLFGHTTRLSAQIERFVTDSSLNALSVDQRLRWGLRVAAHSISTGGLSDSTVRVPSSWPFPASVAISLRATADSVVLSSREPASDRACRFTLYLRVGGDTPLAGRSDPVRCAPASRLDWRESRVLSLQRVPWPDHTESSDPRAISGDAWPEYRYDAARTGAGRPQGAGGRAWRAIVDGELRATASVVGDKVLVGTHGAGALHAFEFRSGHLLWMHYLPNWIHQDAVSDGQEVIVGFGDNEEALYGESPAGASAFSLDSGALLWTAFEGNSLMTSPAIWGKNAVYVTSAGTVKIRDLLAGTEIARLKLPGRAIMAPPAVRGDTLVAALDSARVCAVRLQPLDSIWCRRLPGAGMVGHSAPTVFGDRVYVTSAVLKTEGRFGMSWFTWYRVMALFGWLGPGSEQFAGQQVWALALSTGRVDWVSRVYPAVREADGHVSGTLVGTGGVGVVLLPLAGKMVALDPVSGRELWTAEVGGSRGPVALTNDRFVLTLRSGELRVVSVTGEVKCSIRTNTTFDRAGPTIADSTVIIAARNGVLSAVPLALLTGCVEKDVRALVQ